MGDAAPGGGTVLPWRRACRKPASAATRRMAKRKRKITEMTEKKNKKLKKASAKEMPPAATPGTGEAHAEGGAAWGAGQDTALELPELTPEEKRVLERKLKKERRKEERKQLRKAAVPSVPAKPSGAQLALDYLRGLGAGLPGTPFLQELQTCPRRLRHVNSPTGKGPDLRPSAPALADDSHAAGDQPGLAALGLFLRASSNDHGPISAAHSFRAQAECHICGCGSPGRGALKAHRFVGAPRLTRERLVSGASWCPCRLARVWRQALGGEASSQRQAPEPPPRLLVCRPPAGEGPPPTWCTDPSVSSRRRLTCPVLASQLGQKHENWKFQKTRQTWLLLHMYDNDQVPDELFSTLLAYLEGLRGRARELTVQKAEALMQKSDEATGADTLPLGTIQRVRQVLQLLS
ncbi:uncharacterized protein C7orf50 homolog [Neofelis nebulosa]|uniref:uncharacterized protein C7orf50 homolog n=1 Tax=Neofelis nebulosa TaxID=61452 RepID=UPI00272A8D92|nr:uncharacterized protein C7orf50 homolog [Neofelis nebulosa]